MQRRARRTRALAHALRKHVLPQDHRHGHRDARFDAGGPVARRQDAAVGFVRDLVFPRRDPRAAEGALERELDKVLEALEVDRLGAPLQLESATHLPGVAHGDGAHRLAVQCVDEAEGRAARRGAEARWSGVLERRVGQQEHDHPAEVLQRLHELVALVHAPLE